MTAALHALSLAIILSAGIAALALIATWITTNRRRIIAALMLHEPLTVEETVEEWRS